MNLEEAIREIPEGWRRAFGKEMYEELSAMLYEQRDEIKDYKVLQVGERFGELRWHDENGTTQTDAIVDRYAELSGWTCIVCGRPATRITLGRVRPYCTACCARLPQDMKYVEIDRDTAENGSPDYRG